MNKNIKVWSLIAVMLLGVVGACNDDPPLPDNLANFETEAVGFTGNETAVKVLLSRTEDVAVQLTVSLVESGVTYGTQYETVPAVASGKLTLTVPAGSSEASLTVKKKDGVFLNGDEKIDFTIETSTDPVLVGETKIVKLSFSAITSEGSTLTLQGKTTTPSNPPVGADNYVNTVYVDLSANQQALVNRKSWNLGFYNGVDFKVILNPGYQSTAAPLTKTDITTVTLADAETVLNLAHDAILTDPATAALADSWDGDLTKTTFATVSATDAENKVYLVSCEGSKTPKSLWFKVKVTRDGTTGYKVQYARIGETTIKSITIPKNTTHNLSFLSLENEKTVSVEPVKGSWDIAWGYSTLNSGLNTPYWGQDLILLNYMGGAEAAEVVSTGADATAAATASAALYTSFAETNIIGLTFLKTRDAIGSKWRSTQPATGIRRDRFYVIKDARGNYYKLKFITMGVADAGVRGNTVIEYKLVKKGS